MFHTCAVRFTCSHYHYQQHRHQHHCIDLTLSLIMLHSMQPSIECSVFTTDADVTSMWLAAP